MKTKLEIATSLVLKDMGNIRILYYYSYMMNDLVFIRYSLVDAYNNRQMIAPDDPSFNSYEKIIDCIKDYLLFGRVPAYYYIEKTNNISKILSFIVERVPRNILNMLCNGEYDEIIEKYGLLM